MAKKKQKKKKHAHSNPKPVPIVEEARFQWPEAFSSPRITAVILAVILLAGVAIYAGGASESLLFVKKALARSLGMLAPDLVSPSVWQVACVLWLGVLVVGLGLIHPALGIAVLLFFRPWLDGYTYPTDNLYFVWGIYYLLALWAARMLLRGESLRHKGLLGLLLLYLLTAVITASSSYEWSQTLRALILWSAYVGLFFLVTQSLRDRSSFLVISVALVLVLLSEAAYGVIHYHYTLPALRHQLAVDPQMRLSQFGTMEFTPELIRRFNINRAFGTMLFPNTLAGLLLLGLPATLGWAVQAWKRFQTAPRVLSVPQQRRIAVKAVAATMTGGSIFLLLLITLRFIAAAQVQMGVKPSWWMGQTGSLGITLICGGIVVAISLLLLQKKGWTYFRCLLWSILTMASVFFQCWALWLTYSRGAWLSLIVVVALMPVLLLGYKKMPIRVKTVAPVLLLLIMFAGIVYPGQTIDAQDRLVIPSEAQRVLSEGADVALSDLANPASLSLRFGYWKAAGAMFLKHPLTGVGLGAYGSAFPSFQALNGGAVREAHNAYLQAFAETGLIGGLAFLAFWLCLLGWSFRRIMALRGEAGGALRWGFFIGLCAFLLHAGLDIHFSHPTLMMFCMVMAGMLVTLLSDTESNEEATKSSWLSRITALGILLAVANLMGFSVCIYARDFTLSRGNMLNVASAKERTERLQVSKYLFTTVRWSAESIPTQGPKYLPASTLMKLIPSPKDWHEMGQVVVPIENSKKFKQLGPEESVTTDTLILFPEPKKVVRHARRWSLLWLRSVADRDALFPQDPALAAYLAQGYEIVAQSIQGEKHAEARGKAWRRARHWSSEALRRAPKHGSMHFLMGNCLSKQADMETGEIVLALRQDALTYYRQAAALSPAFASPHFRLATALEQTAALLSEEAARPLLEESKTVREQAKFIARQRGTYGFAQ